MGRKRRMRIVGPRVKRRFRIPLPRTGLTMTKRKSIPVGVIGDPGTVSQTGYGIRMRHGFRGRSSLFRR
jgi:hypothetical protein